MHIDRRRGRGKEGGRGQILPLFAISLVAILALVGLGLDGAQTFLERRDAQGAADLAALSGARFLPNDPTKAIAQAKTVGVLNGYEAADVQVTTPYLDDPSKIKVVIDSEVGLFFLPVLGINELDVDAGAGAIAAGAAASCSFCSLNPTSKNHTLLLKNGSTLRVDGDIIVNSTNGGVGPGCTIYDWEVCGDGFDIFGSPAVPPAYISAKSISVAGGWETHDENVVMSDGKVWPDYSTSPPTYRSCPSVSPNPALQPLTQLANVCVHVPQIVDPLDNPAFPSAMVPTPVVASHPVPNAGNCPTGTKYPAGSSANASPLLLTSNATICPGIYYGGLEITSGTTTMLPGFYFMAGKNGMVVSGSGSLDGTAGVTIYSSASLGASSDLLILPNPDLAKPLDPARLDPILRKFESDKNPVSVGSRVKYKFEIEPVPGGPKLNGTIRFFDGDTDITNGTKCKPKVLSNEGKKKSATCEITYSGSDIGTHGIAAVFFSDDTCSAPTCYNNLEAVLNPVQVVTGSSAAGDIEINTTGNVQLSSSGSGQYKGLVFYQDRKADGSILLTNSTGKAACSPTTSVTVAGVVGPKWALQQPPGKPCGPLGGIEGTIYAPHFNSIVTTTISGLANVQVISGKMLIDSTSTTRFAFDGSLFAGNQIALFE